MCNRDNAPDIATCPEEESAKRSEATNQAQIKMKSRQCF